MRLKEKSLRIIYSYFDEFATQTSCRELMGINEFLIREDMVYFCCDNKSLNMRKTLIFKLIAKPLMMEILVVEGDEHSEIILSCKAIYDEIIEHARISIIESCFAFKPKINNCSDVTDLDFQNNILLEIGEEVIYNDRYFESKNGDYYNFIYKNENVYLDADEFVCSLTNDN